MMVVQPGRMGRFHLQNCDFKPEKPSSDHYSRTPSGTGTRPNKGLFLASKDTSSTFHLWVFKHIPHIPLPFHVGLIKLITILWVEEILDQLDGKCFIRISIEASQLLQDALSMDSTVW